MHLPFLLQLDNGCDVRSQTGQLAIQKQRTGFCMTQTHPVAAEGHDTR